VQVTLNSQTASPGLCLMLVSCCRLVTIQFYIYDNEVQIIEPKVTNAG
jgi:hypothetical protein